MVKTTPWATFCFDFGKSVLVFLVLGLAWVTLQWAPAGLSCVNRAPEGTFVAFCNNGQFGDYEHGAFFLGLEQKAIERARAADVVFLGNSRGQFAFSTEAARAFFDERSIAHYLLGFAYDERSQFALDVMLRNGVRPKVVVVNADPFFSRRPSEVAKSLDRAGLAVWLSYIRKMAAQLIGHAICGSVASLCPSPSPAVYREAIDGSWRWKGFYLPEQSVPIPASRPPMTGRGMEDALSESQAFVRRSGIRPECLVLTAIPQTFDDPEPFVRRLGQALGAPVVMPKIDGLVTFDTAHLNQPSAERWSKAFFEEFEPILRRCLASSAN